MSCGIYKWTSPSNKSYIGKSVDLEKRKKEFERNKFYTVKNSKIDNARHKYPIHLWTYEVIEYCSKDELNEREIYYISFYDTYNNGYNSTLGGDGNNGIIINEETRSKLRDAINRRPKELQDKFIYSITPTKPIIQYSIDGKYIKRWKSAREVAHSLNLSASEIGAVCLGKYGRKTAGGYVFRFEGDSFDKYSIKPKRNTTPIEWIDDNNNVIKDFNSIRQAEEYFGKKLNISYVCQGLRKHTCGLIFRYKINE